MWLSDVWDWILNLFVPTKTKTPPTVKLTKKGYINEGISWQTYSPYMWKFDVDGDELTIVYNNDTTFALWSAFKNDKLTYLGNYTGMIERYPYIYDFIEYM
jgi:hypothetical protein